MNTPLVGIVMGSDSDWPVMRACAETFKKFDIPYEAKVLSAHRTPDAALDYAASAQERGIKVRIGAAGDAEDEDEEADGARDVLQPPSTSRAAAQAARLRL